MLKERFDRVDEKFDRVNERFDEVNRRIREGKEDADRRFDAVGHRFDEVGRRLSGIEEIKQEMRALQITFQRGNFALIASVFGVLVATILKGG